MANLILGIDFGTSTTVLRFRMADSDAIYPVKDRYDGCDYIPTVMFKPQNEAEKRLYGNEALNAADEGKTPGELISNFKMGFYDSDPVVREECKNYIKDFFVFLYECFAQSTSGRVYDQLEVRVSYPAKWGTAVDTNDSYVGFLKSAVSEGGFGAVPLVITSVSEPKAAALHLLNHHLPDKSILSYNKPLYVFMLDMGAGTTDIVIFELVIQEDESVSIDKLLCYPPKNNSFLGGGREIDKMLQEFVLSQLRSNGVPSDESYFTLKDAKKWKDQELSKALYKGMNGTIPISLMTSWLQMGLPLTGMQSFLLPRELFENRTQVHWKELYEMISSSMRKYKKQRHIGPEDIDLLFLTGGHSQWYTVPNLFNGKGVNVSIGKEGEPGFLNFVKVREDPSTRMFSDASPHECVAMGLCSNNQTITVRDTSANSIWIQFSINDNSSDVIELIHAGKEELPFSTAVESKLVFQRYGVLDDMVFDIQIHIYIGESIESAEHKVCRIRHDAGNGLFWRLLMLALRILFLHFSKDDYVFGFNASIDIQKDGNLDLSGDIVIDGTKKFSFSKQDLVVA